jgi:hypothetical protein
MPNEFLRIAGRIAAAAGTRSARPTMRGESTVEGVHDDAA